MLQLEVLVGKLRPINGLATRTVVVGEVAALDHEVRDDAVKRRVFVSVAFFARAQGAEVLRRLGNDVGEEFKGDATSILAVDVDVEANFGLAMKAALTTGLAGWRQDMTPRMKKNLDPSHPAVPSRETQNTFHVRGRTPGQTGLICSSSCAPRCARHPITSRTTGNIFTLCVCKHWQMWEGGNGSDAVQSGSIRSQEETSQTLGFGAKGAERRPVTTNVQPGDIHEKTRGGSFPCGRIRSRRVGIGQSGSEMRGMSFPVARCG